MRANLTAGYATVVRWEMARGRSEAEAHESALAAIYERGADDAASRAAAERPRARLYEASTEADLGSCDPLLVPARGDRMALPSGREYEVVRAHHRVADGQVDVYLTDLEARPRRGGGATGERHWRLQVRPERLRLPAARHGDSAGRLGGSARPVDASR